MRLAIVVPSVLSLALVSAPPTAQAQSESDGSVGSAVLGGFLGAYSGLMVGNLTSRHIFCSHKYAEVGSACAAPLIIGSALGLGVGAYAGAESSHRVKGAYLGAGFGALAGLVTLAVFFRSELEKQDELQPLFAAVFIGAALGAIAGGIIAGDRESGNNANSKQLPIGIRLSF